MSDFVPKYIELINWVKEKIKTGEFKPGDKLYSENQLGEMFSMSRQTVRHAISKLEQEGLVERVQGSGTYIGGKEKQNRTRAKTRNIAIITPYLDQYIFPNIIKDMEKVISEAGYFTQIAFTYNTLERESVVLKKFLENDVVDGMIIEPTKSALPNPNIHLYEELIKRGIPLLFINSFYPGLDVAHVVMDDMMAGYLAVNHLIEAGHTKIAGIFKCDDMQGHLRYKGYLKGMLNAGLNIHDEYIIWYDSADRWSFEDNEKRILNRISGCTACVCYNDDLAVLLINLLKRNGIQVPERFSIVGIDNSDLAELCEIPLTTVTYPINKMGKKAAKNLLKMMENENYDANHVFIPALVVRDSVAKIEKTEV